MFGDVIKLETKNKKYSSHPLQQDTNSLYKQGPKPLVSRKDVHEREIGNRFLCVPHRSSGFGVSRPETPSKVLSRPLDLDVEKRSILLPHPGMQQSPMGA